MAMKIAVAASGFLTTVQDRGRLGFRRFGVSAGGALDSHAFRLANLMVGNDETAAGLEITLGGLHLKFNDDRLVAWCGGEFVVRIGAVPLPAGRPAVVSTNEELSMTQSRIGCRAWLAISGGLNVPSVLESRSTDLRSHFGGLDGRALRDGDAISLGDNSERAQLGMQNLAHLKIANWSAPHDWASPMHAEPLLRIIRGPEWDRFHDAAHRALTNGPFVVSSASDRMGARLTGPFLQRNDDVDLISEAVAPGTIQVPPSGQPIVLLGDCQTIGGYPKIAHVITIDLPVAAQLRAGDQVRLREISLARAHRLLFERERDFNLFRAGLEARDS
jgi:antagonist of KipI